MKRVVLAILLIILLGMNPSAIYGHSTNLPKLEQLNPNIQHTVRKGESISSILKKYQMPLDDFMKANPDVANSAKVTLGQRLAIPRSSIGLRSNAVINREVKAFMANFKQSQNQSEQKSSNQPATTILETPPTTASTTTALQPQLQKLDPSTKKFDYHTVMPKETLYSLSKLYNVTVDEILKYNVDVKEGGLKERSTIRIPRFGVSSAELAKPSDATTTTPVQEELKYESRDFEVFESDTEKMSVKIAMLMPILGESDPREDGFKDIYRGVLLAADSLKRCGISTKIDMYGIGRGNDLVYSLINEGRLKGVDLIVGPVFEGQMQLVAPYALTSRIPTISPLMAMGIDNEYLIEINPEKSLRYEKADGFFDDKRVIYYQSSNDDKAFLAELAKVGGKPDTTLLYDKFMTPDSMATILQKDVENVFIVSAKDNLNIELLMSKLTALKATAYNRKMSVFGAPHLSNIPKEKRSDFFKSDTRYITSSFQDRTNEASMAFETAYIDMFGYVPTPFSYRGYEIGMLFLPEIAENGKDFIESMNDVLKQVVQVPYLFYRDNNYSKFVNQEWLLVNYRPNYSIKID